MKVDWFKTVQFLFAGQFCLKVIWRFRMEPHETAKASNRNDGLKLLLIVCSARALSNGCKSRVSPNSGNYIANGKGVHREVKSERSRRQTSDLTDRNFIQGI